MSASPIDRQMYARQYLEITEEFPALAENAGCQTLQELSTLNGDEPYANFGLEDARTECYNTWFSYKEAARNEWCSSYALTCSTLEVTSTWFLTEAQVVQTMGHGLVAAGSMVLDGKFNELLHAAGEGIASSVRNILPNIRDAALALYAPELPPETVASALSKPALDAVNIYGVYALAASLVGLAEAGIAAAPKLMPPAVTVTPEGLNLSVMADTAAANKVTSRFNLPNTLVIPKKPPTPINVPKPHDIGTMSLSELNGFMNRLVLDLQALQTELAGYVFSRNTLMSRFHTIYPKLQRSETALLNQLELLGRQNTKFATLRNEYLALKQSVRLYEP